MNEVPFPRSGLVQKGVIYRAPAPPALPRRPLDPEVLAALQRGREKIIREYLSRRRAS